MGVDYKLIGSRIKNKRKITLLTQEKMAEMLQVSIGYVSQIERGIAKPNLEMLSSISEILKCDISEFISNVSENKDDFLNREISEMLLDMNSDKKQMLYDIAEVIKKY